MADYLIKGNKSVMCDNNHIFEIPLHTTITKCPVCDIDVIVEFCGVVIDKYGNYVY